MRWSVTACMVVLLLAAWARPTIAQGPRDTIVVRPGDELVDLRRIVPHRATWRVTRLDPDGSGTVQGLWTETWARSSMDGRSAFFFRQLFVDTAGALLWSSETVFDAERLGTIHSTQHVPGGAHVTYRHSGDTVSGTLRPSPNAEPRDFEIVFDEPVWEPLVPVPALVPLERLEVGGVLRYPIWNQTGAGDDVTWNEARLDSLGTTITADGRIIDAWYLTGRLAGPGSPVIRSRQTAEPPFHPWFVVERPSLVREWTLVDWIPFESFHGQPGEERPRSASGGALPPASSAGSAFAAFLKGEGPNPSETPTPDAARCALTAPSARWIQTALHGWERVALDFLRLDPEPLPWMVLFDRSCTWHLAAREGQPADADPVTAGLTFAGASVPVRVMRHEEVIRLPSGSTIPVRGAAFASLYEREPGDPTAFFVLALPDVWRDTLPERPDLVAEMLGVAIHELVHTRQLPHLARRIEALKERDPLPERIHDDMLEERFAEIPEFVRAHEEETDLLYRAVSAPDPTLKRALVRQALRVIRDRQERYFRDRDAVYRELEELFLNMEGVAVWARSGAGAGDGIALPVAGGGGHRTPLRNLRSGPFGSVRNGAVLEGR